MGLNWHSLVFLCDQVKKGVRLGDVATIGRLDNFCGYEQAKIILREYFPERSLREIERVAAQKYSEGMLEFLGARSVSSFDFSDYEGATHIFDLNLRFPDHLHERFDLVMDGGTIEHVFDVRLSMINLMSLARVGGRVMFTQMGNNFCGHGFYQFSPEFFYRVLSDVNGFCVERCVVHEAYMYAPIYEVPDPKTVRSRIELATDWAGVHILVLAKRLEARALFSEPPQQSDYQMLWEEGDRTEIVHQKAVPTILSKVKSALRPYLKYRHPFFWKNQDFIWPIFRFLYVRKHRRAFSRARQPDKFIRRRRTQV